MKKIYIKPNQRIHILSCRDGILDTVSTSKSSMTTTDTFGARQSDIDEEETMPDTKNNLWSQEW